MNLLYFVQSILYFRKTEERRDTYYWSNDQISLSVFLMNNKRERKKRENCRDARMKNWKQLLSWRFNYRHSILDSYRTWWIVTCLVSYTTSPPCDLLYDSHNDRISNSYLFLASRPRSFDAQMRHPRKREAANRDPVLRVHGTGSSPRLVVIPATSWQPQSLPKPGEIDPNVI